MNIVAAVITTYNRLDLLKENINALLNQKYCGLDVLVIDNASTDGTKEYVSAIPDDRVKYFNTGKNFGGAGGFAFGVKQALELGYRFLWIMDDDSIPERSALQHLMNKVEDLNADFSFFASTVYWTDGSIFPMNLPELVNQTNTYIDLIKNYNIIPIRTCSFVGCFVNAEVAKETALPIAEYFIYGDDVEYTARLAKMKPAYWVYNSTIVHKAPSKIGSDVVNAPADRLDRFYKQTRNGIHICRNQGGLTKYLFTLFKRIIRIIIGSKDHKVKRVLSVLCGAVSGFFFNPHMKYAVVNEGDKRDV